MPTLAQRLRKNPTPAEVRFWRLIDPLRRSGHHFRKQVAVGRYIVDFACHRDHLVVEIDGDTHYTDEDLAKDRVRDAYLASRGFAVLRFTNLDVMTNPEGVYMTLAAALVEGTPSLPSPQGGG
jgi:very-short-patch-repair endonuclease